MHWMDGEVVAWLSLIGVVLLHVIGVLHVLHAVMNVRTAQGTIAWVVSLVTFPYLAIPLYWLLGRNRFEGYVRGRRADDEDLARLAKSMYERVKQYEVDVPYDDAFARAAQLLGGLPFTRGNDLELLIDGEQTFSRLFEQIRQAKNYVCVNFYIVKSDRIGLKFRDLLIEKANQGVRIWFLFDEFGSHKLPRKYLNQLKAAGIECRSFGANRHWWSRLQLNFRNHRKVVVVDGKIGFMGGLNVGDEYLGRSQKFGQWRDTHLEIRGPAVQALQMVFLGDWYWATGVVPPELEWEIETDPADEVSAIIPTGPADPGDSWKLMVAEAANTSRQRLWIASPYFVPDDGALTALQTAALRGVDVRILIPERADHLLVWLSAFSYYEQSIPYGVKLYRYHRGFLHQKVMLVDDRLATVGTANLDNRSFRLNFELTALSPDKGFVGEVEAMLTEDFENASLAMLSDFRKRSFFFKVGVRVARLFAPIQ
ncbi:cardiolipin synthase [Luteolibacter pohnpeiensis]|uniref:Cardiolipin synthase n=1 Tax=Luteolibacter pohnpeiensis TaxID=454153 RepID=A0A934S5R9_9BACT|nr:cardiolipin synthase [Luteolibacter pohnpeiensis]MBK1883106.1 cardiolipin synthase [Luteolibacter pohnpeiensis]